MSAEDVVAPTHQGLVAAFYLAKTGGLPKPYGARDRLLEEINELVVAVDLDATNTAQLKELADVLYVAYGYALSRGWNLTRAFEAVHASNMTKEWTESGKVQKGAGYVPPDLMGCA